MMDEKDTGGVQLLLLLFFLFSAAGWLWEVLFVALTTGEVVNRGVLRGPWLPIYGVGGVLILLLLGRKRGPGLFLLSALVGAGVEYAASLALEALFRRRWWDYAAWPWDFQGRVCLGSAAAFGLLGWLLVRLLAPALAKLLSSVPERARRALCRWLGVLFLLDAAAALAAPNVGAGISFPV